MENTKSCVLVLCVLFSSCLVLVSALDSKQVYFHQSSTGQVACPLIADRNFSVSNVEAAYWYRQLAKAHSLLISKFQGSIHVPGSKQGKYNITKNLSLLITDFTESDGGRFFCQLRIKERPGFQKSRLVDVSVSVSPNGQSPMVEECDMTEHQDGCLIQLQPWEMEYHLTCHVTNARPAVQLHWLQALQDGSTEALANVTYEVGRTNTLKTATHPQDESLYTSSATVTVIYYNEMTLLCQALGLAMGDRNGTFVNVHITRSATTTSSNPSSDLISSTSLDAKESLDLSWLVVIVVLCLVVSVVATFITVAVIFLVKKKYCRRKAQNVRDEMEMGRLKDVENGTIPIGDILKICADQLKTYYMGEMSTIPIHPILLATARHIKDLFISLQLFKQTSETVRADKPVRLKGKRVFYPDDRVKVPLDSQDDLTRLLIKNGHVVVVGVAGRGKTTLTRKLAYDWSCAAADSVLSHFKYVFLLRMKELQGNSGLLDAILKILPKDTQISRGHLRDLIEANQKDVLFVLDGFDEVSSRVMDSPPAHIDDYSIKDVLSFKALRDCSVFITTRPHKLDKLQEYYSNYTVVETTGFSSDNRNKYIRQFFTDETKGEALIQEVQSTAFILTLSQSPIMLLLLCIIWNHDQSIPQRLTDLYERAVKVLVDHFSHKYDSIVQQNLEALKEEIGQVAFEGLIDPQGERLVFSPDEFLETLQDGLAIGILYQETKAVVQDYVRMVNFLHKSFQEFFAANYLATKENNLLKEKLLPLITIETIQEKEYLLRFCCGKSADAAALILEHVNSLKEDLQTPAYLWIQNFSLVLVFEAQSSDLVAAVGSRLTLKYKEDFPAMEYYLQRFPSGVELERLNIHLTLIPDQSLARKILERVVVESLYFHIELSDQLQDQLTALSETISKMPHQPQFTRLYVATESETASENQVTELCQFIRNQSGVEVFGIGLAGKILSSSEVFKELVDALVACRAAYLCIDDNYLHGYLGCLSPIFQHVTSLVLRRCSLSDDDIIEVSGALMTSDSYLTCLYFEGCEFSLDAVDTLVRTVNNQTSMNLEKLYLNDVGPDSTAVSQIVKKYLPVMEETKKGFFIRK